MARPKQITDEQLLQLIDEFFSKECQGKTQSLKLPAIAEYVASHGFEGYRVESLRRNNYARSYIDSLSQNKDNTAHALVVAYRTLNVSQFLDKNPTRSSLIKSLTELDTYYHRIADAASLLSQKETILADDNNRLKAENETLKSENKENSSLIQEQTRQIRALKKEIKALRAVVNDYVYPEIANELLVQDGELISDPNPYIDAGLLENNIISSSTHIEDTNKKSSSFQSESSVITSLFEDLED